MTPPPASPPASPPVSPTPVKAAQRFKLPRWLAKLHARLHEWAESGWAGPAVGSWNLLQGSVVPGPSDALLAPLVIADPPRALKMAAWATAGATLGGWITYAIGALAYESVGVPLLALVGIEAATIESQRARFLAHGWFLVALSAVTPIPTKAVSLAAGAFGVPPWQFGVALFVGRGLRFTVVALLCAAVGRRVPAPPADADADSSAPVSTA